MKPEVKRILKELKENLNTANQALFINKTSTPNMQEIAKSNCEKAEKKLQRLEEFLSDEAA